MDWTLLPQGPLSLISELLQSEIDVVRFRSVCTSWRSAAPRRQSPWFLSDGECAALFALSGIRIPNVPELFPSRPYCSSYGWIADRGPNRSFTHGQPITLVNPITMDRIDLPGISGFDLSSMTLVLSSDPATTSDYTAATFSNGKLAIYRSGDEAWSVTPFPGSKLFPESDLSFYRGLIYISDVDCIFVFDPAAEVKLVQTIPVPCVEWCLGEAFCECRCLFFYLVESCGDLLLVRRDPINANKMIEVLKLQFCGGGLPRMVKMESLGETALFIDFGCSFSLSAVKFPEYKGNHIYFGYYGQHNDVVNVFNLADGKVEPATSGMKGLSFTLWFRPHLSY